MESEAPFRAARRLLTAALLGSVVCFPVHSIAWQPGLPIEPREGLFFGDVPLGQSRVLEVRVCKPVSGNLAVGFQVDPPFAMTRDVLALGRASCGSVGVRFSPTEAVGSFRWIRIDAVTQELDPSARQRFSTLLPATGRGVPPAGFTFLSVETVGPGGVVGPGISCPGDCRELVPVGTEVELIARPAVASSGSVPFFERWDGACAGTPEPRCRLVVADGAPARAVFHSISVLPAPYVPLSVNVGAGGLVVGPDDLRCTGPARCTRSFRIGKRVTLGAVGEVVASGSEGFTRRPFVGWSGACDGQGAACTLSIRGPTEVAAAFGDEPLSRQGFGSLFVTSIEGSGRVVSNSPRVDCPGICGVPISGAGVVLFGLPDPGWEITRWGWKGCRPHGSDACVVAGGDRAVAVIFTPKLPPPEPVGTSRVSVAVVGSGRVAGPRIGCPGDCDAVLPRSSVVTLAAVPSEDWAFGGWEGHCGGQGTLCRLRLEDDVQTAAQFADARLPLEVQVSGEGRVVGGRQPDLRGCCSFHGGVCGCDGEVVSCCDGATSPTCRCTDIFCPSRCRTLLSDGAAVVLTATPSAGWRFAGWDGACPRQVNPCSLIVGVPTSVGATFVRSGSGATAADPVGWGTSDACIASSP